MALPSKMASAMIKSTYTLDQDTVRKVERLACKWKVSKSEVLRRAVAAAKDESPEDLTPMEALRRVQKELNLSAKQVSASGRMKPGESGAICFGSANGPIPDSPG